MSRLRDTLLAIGLEMASLVLAPLAVVAVFFRGPRIRTDVIATSGEDGAPMYVDRALLPRWLWWWQTPDELLPGGMYEATVRGWYASWGWHYCAARWLLRNRLYGLAWTFGRPADGYLDPVPGGIAQRGDLWRWWRRFGPIVLQAGWKVHRADWQADAQRGPFIAVPFATIRLRRNS